MQKLHFAIVSTNISYPYNPLIANVLYSTTYIENWGSGVKRIMEACEKRGVAAPTWTINGGFVVVTFMAQAKYDIRRKCPICGAVFQIRTIDSVYCHLE